MTIKEIPIGESGIIESVGGEGALRQHFLDLGLIPGTTVTMVRHAPMGDPVEVRLHGYALTLRLAEAEQIGVAAASGKGDAAETETASGNDDAAYNDALHEHNAHPGLGEAGKYHDTTHERPLPKETTLTFALAGQQNCGKTTLFNQLTGSNQHVGNFPGVTVDRKDGTIKGHAGTRVTDLPGIYSLSPYSAEELVSRQFLLGEKPKGIINIIDASNIERNLYLTMQLMELGVPMVIALNMIDEVRSNGGSIRVNEMEKILGVPVVPISALKNEGVDELVEHALHVARYQEAPVRQDFCDKYDAGGAVHRCLHSIMHLIEDHAAAAGLPLRFAAAKVAEGDSHILEMLKLTQNELETVEHLVLQMEEERGLDRSAAIADMRYTFIQRLCRQTVVHSQENRQYRRSQRIDRVMTGRWTALPIFVAVMAMILWLSIDVLGAPLQGWLSAAMDSAAGWVDAAMARGEVSPAVRGLVTNGLFGGVGSVMSFVPIIILLFFFLSLLEDSGYMARVAFVTDKTLRRLGLSGHCIVPLLIGFGCSVPAVMASRTLPSQRDRWMTIRLTPFVSCPAKIPIYAFLASHFFPGRGGVVLVALYLLGIAMGAVAALAMKWMHGEGEAAPFVMELPNYRMPGWKNMAHLLWDKTRDFVQRAFSVILVATVAIWLLQTFDFRFQMVEGGEGSMLAALAGTLTPLFRPIGLGSWQLVTALISGFVAKESVVSTLQVLDATTVLTTVTVVPMLVFSLLYTPCVATIAAIRREQGLRSALLVVAVQCAIAWLAALAAYAIASSLA